MANAFLRYLEFSKFGGRQKFRSQREPSKSNVIFLKSHPRFAGHARYYDPNTGRFLQKDPDPGKLEIAVTTINRYAYVGNNPRNQLDASGKNFLTALNVAFSSLGLGQIVSVAISGLTMGVSNLIAGIRYNGSSPLQIISSVVIGLWLGAGVAAASIFGGPLAGIAAAGVAAGLNNIANQYIYHDPDDVSWSRAGNAAISGLFAGVLGEIAGDYIFKTGFKNGVGASTGAGTSGALGWSIDTGIQDENPHQITFGFGLALPAN